MLKLTHIINPVKVNQSSDLFIAQPVTFESMKKAKTFAKEDIEVNLVTTQYSEDHSVIPEYFNKTIDLERSVLDFGTFNKQRKLPLIKDILKRAFEFDKDADYIIYTNVDIALTPHFYLFVNEHIKKGFDAFVINRRTISNKYTRREELPLMYSEIGKEHPGFDCFVFKRELFNKFIFKKICIGTTRIGLAIISNLIIFSNKYRIYKDEHLTFHIGEDKVWLDDNLNDYVKHNENEVISILSTLRNLNTKKFENDKILNKYYKVLSEKKNQKNKLNSFFKRLF